VQQRVSPILHFAQNDIATEECRGAKPLFWGFGACPELVEGYPPDSKVPQDWGIKGVEKTFVNALLSR
jgi:hypothetical protein